MPSAKKSFRALAQQIFVNQVHINQLTAALANEHLKDFQDLWEEIHRGAVHSPRAGLILAGAAREIADRGADQSQRSQARLVLMQILNSLGHFGEVVALCAETVEIFMALGNEKGILAAWLQAGYAETYLGDLNSARQNVERAGTVLEHLSDAEKYPLQRAQSDWVGGRILRDEGDYAEATQIFKQARETFNSAGAQLEGARLTRELGQTYTRTDPIQAVPLLEQARRIFERTNCPVDLALCDLYLGYAFNMLGDFDGALHRLARARAVFTEQGSDFFVASCDLDRGFVELRLNHYDEAISILLPARAVFLSCGSPSEASSCDVNIGAALLELNRYEEALARLQQAATLALENGRRKKAARCYMNMGWGYDKQGRYSDALDFYQRARDEFARETMLEPLLYCDLNIALTYQNLNQPDQALNALTQAQQISESLGLSSELALGEMYRSRVYLQLGRRQQAQATLKEAREIFLQTRQELYLAICDRLIAQTDTERANKKETLARLSKSRSLFLEHGQLIDVALCDLTRGELHLHWCEWKAASRYFRSAYRRLETGFPDQAWRASYGMAQVEVHQKRKRVALQHYLRAVDTIAGIRASLGLEQLSDDLFGAREQVFIDALTLTHSESQPKHALGIVEAAKAQTFLNYLVTKEWRVQEGSTDLVNWAELNHREQELRYKLEALRRHASVHVAQSEGEPLQSPEELERFSGERSNELGALSKAYESIVARLRLSKRGLSGVPSLAPFSLDNFRRTAKARWGERWAALDYFLDGNNLLIVSIDPHTVELHAVHLDEADQFALEQATSIQPDTRELVFRGTIRGTPIPTSGARYLEQLTARIIPDHLVKSKQEITLIISPHGRLHQLPFHALMDERGYLLERFRFVYTPGLQALTQLHSGRATMTTPSRMLVYAADDFSGRARPLRHAYQEIQAITRSGNESAITFWNAEATRDGILELNRSRELEKFDILHFATHAILDQRAPHWSRIMLQDQDLTVLDILDLKLNARLVTLSACSSGLAKAGRGDELVGLARAFFYAGARALVASLWAVEDESTAHLMAEFYRNLKTGLSISEALRQAQLQMVSLGFSPYQWAPFLAIGAA